MLDQPTFKSFFMISCYIWYYNNLNLKFEISVPRILQRCSLQDLYLYWVSYFNLSNLHAILSREKKHISSSQWAKSSDLIWVKDNIFLTSSLLTQYWFLTISSGLVLYQILTFNKTSWAHLYCLLNFGTTSVVKHHLKFIILSKALLALTPLVGW